jgi:SSS family transporter
MKTIVSWMDVAVIIGYLLMMIGIGIWSSKKVKNLNDYALAGRKLGYPVMLGTLIGACIGAASTIGKAGKAYEIGFIFFVATLGYIIGLIFFGFFSKKLRQINITTIPEALKRRYGTGMEVATGGAMALSVIALFGAQIVGMGLVFSSIGSSYGLNYQTCILIAGGILIFYTLVGGLFAVAYTDMIQTVIMLACIGIIMPIIVLNQVSMENLSVLLKPHPGPILGGMTPFYVLSIFIIDFAFCMVDPGLWQRANAARDEKVIKRSMLVTAGIYFYWSLVIVFLGVAGTLLIPDVVARYGSADAIIPALIVNYMPPVVVGLCLVALMAVMMSTASVALLIVGTTVASDLVPAIRPNTSEKGLLIYAKMSILIFGVLGIICALIMKGVFDILLLAFAIYVSAVFVPVMAAFYWEKATKAGAIVSSIVATIVVVALYALNKPYGMEPILISLVVSFVLMWGVSQITYKPESATPRLIPKG